MPRKSSQVGRPGWFWFIDFSLADGVQRQIVPRISSQVGGRG